MKVSLTDTGKRFNRDWIFRHLTYTFEAGKSYAIIGPNGSGKSTLLQVLGGSMQISEGKIQYSILNEQCSVEEVYKHVSLCAPYLEVVEEMTLKEFLNFHRGFKPFLSGLTIEKIISFIGLDKAQGKQIRNFSSGMKQRVRLAQAIFSDVPAVLLDEPCTNLDAAGISLYSQLIHDFCKNRLVIVSSNDEVEYRFCGERINISDYKK
ncbi:MAG: ATP-binding cassette domain-containing protein [Bacteroidetes bacterium]|nr:ATP-binding cassette domain-containing protein [Bacteroidota bacterium]MBS1930989.1 ATP-binding cassette domain-containing protein [Bacteroidota bacterium]